MLDDSLFASDTLHEREVEVAKGKKVKMHFKELPAVHFIRFHQDSASEDAEVRHGAAQRLLAACVCNPDGTPAMTVERAMTLKTGPLNAIFRLVLEVNGSEAPKGND
jgi:hypothetical protein